MNSETVECLEIEPVGECNLRCPVCPVHLRRDTPANGSFALMRFDLYTQILRRFRSARSIRFGGLGEPFMHPRLFDMAREAEERNISASIATNLTVLSRQKAEDCLAAGVSELVIAIDSSNPDLYERLRVGASFARFRDNMEQLTELRQSTGRNLRLNLRTVLMRSNLHELPGIIRFARDFRCDAVSVVPLQRPLVCGCGPHIAPLTKGIEQEELAFVPADEVRQALASAREEAAAASIALTVDGFEAVQTAQPRIPETVCISYQGQIVSHFLTPPTELDPFAVELDSGKTSWKVVQDLVTPLVTPIAPRAATD